MIIKLKIKSFLYIANKKYSHHTNLLCLKDDKHDHYFYIKQFEKLRSENIKNTVITLRNHDLKNHALRLKKMHKTLKLQINVISLVKIMNTKMSL